MAQFPNTTAADGIWTLKKVRRAILGGNWPSLPAIPVGPLLTDFGAATDHGTGLGGAYGIAFNGDGTKFYVNSYSSINVKEYNLSTAYDISTASINYTYNPSYAGGSGINFNNDGTKFFFGDYGTETIYAVNLSTPYNLSTASAVSESLATATNGNYWFSNDGTKVYVTDRSRFVWSYNLSTAFDLSTAGSKSAGIDLTAYTSASLYGGAFSVDGSVLYLGTRSSNIIDRLVLSTPYDETSVISSTSKTFSHSVYHLIFSPDYSLLVTGAGSGSTGTVASYST